MSYPEMIVYSEYIKRKSGAPDTAINLAAAAASYAGYAVFQPISLKRLMFFVTTTVTAGTTAPKVGWLNYPTYANSSGAVTLGTITIPTGAAVGNVYYKDVSDATRILAGTELVLQAPLTQAADSGTAAGAGWMGMVWEPSPDADANNTKVIASA